MKNGNVFERMESHKKPYYVVDQVISAIQEGRLSTGDRLPPEQQIAEMTGVSRPSVREALVILRFAGVLETRLGDGTYVRRANSAVRRKDTKTALLRLLEGGENPIDVIEARRVIEKGIVNLAIVAVTKEDLVELAELFDEMSRLVRENALDGLLRKDREFHMRVAACAGNVLLEKMLESLFDMMERDLWRDIKKRLLERDERYRLRTVDRHSRILMGLRKQDRRAASRSVDAHFDEVERMFIQRQG